MKSDNSEIVIYQSTDDTVKVDCRFENKTFWLIQTQIAQLFDRSVSVISRHIKNIFAEDELDEKSNLQNMQIPNSDKPVTLYMKFETYAGIEKLSSLMRVFEQYPVVANFATTAADDNAGLAMLRDMQKRLKNEGARK